MLWMLALHAAPMRRALLFIDDAPGWLGHPLRMLRLLRERRALVAAQAAAAAARPTPAASDNDARRHRTTRQRRAHLHWKLTLP